MSHLKTVGISLAIAALAIAITFRNPTIRQFVTGA